MLRGEAVDAVIDNLALWESVENPDKKFTKEFNRAGFRGTAIDPMYIIKLATSRFGPVGKGWGWTILSERIEDGHLLSKDGDRYKLWIVLMEVWYMEGENRFVTGPQYGQTPLILADKNGVHTDEEAPKKAVTDALKKCLASLGFAAAIWMNTYDGDKVAEITTATSPRSKHKDYFAIMLELTSAEEMMKILGEIAKNDKIDMDLKAALRYVGFTHSRRIVMTPQQIDRFLGAVKADKWMDESQKGSVLFVLEKKKRVMEEQAASQPAIA